MILSLFELAAVVLLIVGFINEDKVVAFEERLAESFRAHKKTRRR